MNYTKLKENGYLDNMLETYPIIVTGLTLQFNACVNKNEIEVAKDLTKVMVDAINVILNKHFGEGCPELYGTDRDVKIRIK